MEKFARVIELTGDGRLVFRFLPHLCSCDCTGPLVTRVHALCAARFFDDDSVCFSNFKR